MIALVLLGVAAMARFATVDEAAAGAVSASPIATEPANVATTPPVEAATTPPADSR